MKRRDADGIPKPTVDELEADMNRMSGELSVIERWIVRRAERKFAAFRERDKLVKSAYAGGYKTGFEESSILWLLAFGAFLATGYFSGWI